MFYNQSSKQEFPSLENSERLITMDRGSIDHFPMSTSLLELSTEDLPWHISNFQSEIRRGEKSFESMSRIEDQS